MLSSIEWMEQGLCREYPAWMFFPSSAHGLTVAKSVCSNCPVMRCCGEYALSNGIEHGVWGGMSERARRRTRRTSTPKWPEPNQPLPVGFPSERPVNW